MATIGISKPYVATYSNTSGTSTYSSGVVMGKSTTATLTIDGSDANILYADNGPAESAVTFGGATLTVGTDDIYEDSARVFLGINAGEDGEIVYDDTQEIPYVGIGFIVKKQQSGTTYYQGVIFPKAKANNPDFSANTQGESIEWQTPEISFSIMKDDTSTRVWQRNKLFETEALAEAYIKAFLNIE